MFGEGVLATDAFATFLSSPPVANCGGGELLVGGEFRKWRIAAVANARWRIRKVSNRGLVILFSKESKKKPIRQNVPKNSEGVAPD